MIFKNDDCYYIQNMLTENFYYVVMGGRANKIEKFRYAITDILQYLFGGKVEYYYDVQQQIHKYKINNDDIGNCELSVTNEAFIYEPFDVRLKRMCEEYDAYMRCKSRDYKEYKL